MNTCDLINEFSVRYLDDSQRIFGQNRSFDIITKEPPQAIKQLCDIKDSAFKIYGSAGTGNWAEIPWVAILDKNITSSTRTGYYVVFLFSKDMHKVYICLSLEWTQFEDEYGTKEGRLQINATCTHYARLLAGGNHSFVGGGIALGATHNLSKGYEQSYQIQ